MAKTSRVLVMILVIGLGLTSFAHAQDPTDELRQMREKMESANKRFDAMTRAYDHMMEAQAWAGLRESLRAASERGPAEKWPAYNVIDATSGDTIVVDFGKRPEDADATIKRAIAAADAKHEEHKAACLAILQANGVTVDQLPTELQAAWIAHSSEERMRDHYSVMVRAIDRKLIPGESGSEQLAIQLGIVNRSNSTITGLRGRLLLMNPDGSVIKEEEVEFRGTIPPGQMAAHPVIMDVEGAETALLHMPKMMTHTQWVTEGMTLDGTRMLGFGNAKPIGISRPIHPMFP